MKTKREKKGRSKNRLNELYIFPSGWLTIPDGFFSILSNSLALYCKNGKWKKIDCLLKRKIKKRKRNYQKNKSHQNYCEFVRFISLLSTWSPFEIQCDFVLYCWCIRSFFLFSGNSFVLWMLLWFMYCSRMGISITIRKEYSLLNSLTLWPWSEYLLFFSFSLFGRNEIMSTVNSTNSTRNHFTILTRNKATKWNGRKKKQKYKNAKMSITQTKCERRARKKQKEWTMDDEIRRKK